MQLKYLGLPLVAVAAALFFAWTQKPARVADVAETVPVAPPKPSSAGGAPWPASLEQRLASLSDRIARLEIRGDGANDGLWVQTQLVRCFHAPLKSHASMQLDARLSSMRRECRENIGGAGECGGRYIGPVPWRIGCG